MAVIQIPGTKSYQSTITGRVYATRGRAYYAERLSVEKNKFGGYSKIVYWKSAPEDIRKHERSHSNEFVHTMNAVGWDPISIEKLLILYDGEEKESDGSPAWVLTKLLEGSDYTVVYIENEDGVKEWVIRKIFDLIEDTEESEIIASVEEIINEAMKDVPEIKRMLRMIRKITGMDFTRDIRNSILRTFPEIRETRASVDEVKKLLSGKGWEKIAITDEIRKAVLSVHPEIKDLIDITTKLKTAEDLLSILRIVRIA